MDINRGPFIGNYPYWWSASDGRILVAAAATSSPTIDVTFSLGLPSSPTTSFPPLPPRPRPGSRKASRMARRGY